MATSEAMLRAIKKYDEANTMQFKMKLNKKTDADVIEKLASVSSKQGYIKALIRADMEKNRP